MAEVKTKEIFNKGSNTISGKDSETGAKYDFAPDSKLILSEKEANKLLEMYPKQIVSFDAVVVTGITQEKHDEVVKELDKTKKELESVKKELEGTKKELEASKKQIQVLTKK